MRMAIWIIGIVLILDGIVILIKPSWYKKLTAIFTRIGLIRAAAAIKTAFGVFLFIAATSCQFKWIIILIGLITCAASLSMFFLKPDKLKAFITWWSQSPLWVFRLVAIGTIALGALVMYAAGMPQ